MGSTRRVPMTISLEMAAEEKDPLSETLQAQTRDYSWIAASLLHRGRHPLRRVFVSMDVFAYTAN